ncbi:hypothetical protein AWH56_016660 [Anaerobacillus isosaccharinicus]|uniref:Helicase XPB/Ssl2 N-terminal domain-containing protein n=1 Tax=Anaerobacillus isosaccharinicus TaxID=1532552 RepID=A0A1S2M751_9BACI|nr:hypothetical protein [Anaerobacillus isosaccharinicus]MBA5587466.1 hypothetical protein [Anaerobacillus isosaccharinicus]QOY34350.1 hypothetical protein AWH56_016660 [Anaerobacillus isosaccharinicus]
MVIIKLDQCLQELKGEVKQKIIQRQNEFLKDDKRTDLYERLSESDYRKNLLTSLSVIEKKYYNSFLRKYSYYSNENLKEEQTDSIEEKLALLLLRQKGIVYKLDEKIHLQRFIIPIEFVESYFDLTFKYEKIDHYQREMSLKYYLYYLLEIIFLVKEKKIKSMLDLKLLGDRYSNFIDWELLIKFLVKEGLLDHTKKELSVIEKNCQLFFRKSSHEIKKVLTTFILSEICENNFTANFIFWILFTFEGGITRNELNHYLKTNHQYSEHTLIKAIEQLKLLNIISINEEIISATVETEALEHVQGMEAGILEFLLPVSINNEALWTFRCWGMILKWDVMIHILLTQDTVSRALMEQRDEKEINKCLRWFFSDSVSSSWQRTLNQWLLIGKPIAKKGQLVFYSISEGLHLKYIEEHWSEWLEKTENGVVIEAYLTNDFERLLGKLSLNVITEKNEVEKKVQSFHLVIKNEYPEASAVLPEVEKLPKQWFILTAYEERTIQRIVKQAIVLQLRIEIETNDKEILKIIPLKVTNNNGSYDIFTNDKKSISLAAISKIAVIHPLQ